MHKARSCFGDAAHLLPTAYVLVYKTFIGTPVRILAAVAFIFSLTSCGGGSSGAGPAECVANQACIPAGGAAACQVYATACTNGQSSCVAKNAADGSSCATGFCSTGVCTSSTTRTVSSTLETVYLLDDGSRITRAGWDTGVAFDSVVVGLLVPDASHPTGYTTFPVTVGPDSSFSVAGVPFGSYFIEIDQTSTRQNAVPNSNGDTQVAVVERTLYEASTSTPDLSIVVSKRPDVQTLDFASDTTRVQINLTGLSPFVAGDVFRMGSSQNALNAAFTSSDFSPRIAAGSTSVSTSLFWEPEAFGVFPDASKGDSEYFWQRGTQALASDATLSVTKSFVKLTGFTVVAGAANTLTATLAAPPLTGSFTADLRLSQFAALASSVHPGATPSANTTFPPDVAIDSVAHS